MRKIKIYWATYGCITLKSRMDKEHYLSKCSSSLKIFPLYTRRPSHTASPPCTTESNTDTFNNTWLVHQNKETNSLNVTGEMTKINISVPWHFHEVRVHHQPKRVFSHWLGQEEVEMVMKDGEMIPISYNGIWACCRKAGFVPASHIIQVERAANIFIPGTHKLCLLDVRENTKCLGK